MEDDSSLTGKVKRLERCLMQPKVPRTLVGMICVLATIAPARGDDLRTLDSVHYSIHTDLDTNLAQDLARRLDAMYDEYARRLADFSGGSSAGALEVYLFRHQADYSTFTHNSAPNS